MDEIVWKPIPGTSQEIALDTRAHETLYCGSRGPGKSEAQLALFRRYVGQGYGSYWRGIIFDREYKNLDDLVSKSKRMYYAFNDGAKFLASKGEYKWVWPTGEELLFRTLKQDSDYFNFHGQEFCLAVGEKICTNEGDKNIEEMKIGSQVLTAEGYRHVTRIFDRKIKRCFKVYVFDTEGKLLGSQIQSEDHKFLSSDRQSFVKLHGQLQNDSPLPKKNDLLQTAKRLSESHQEKMVYASEHDRNHLFSQIEALLCDLSYTFLQDHPDSSKCSLSLFHRNVSSENPVNVSCGQQNEKTCDTQTQLKFQNVWPFESCHDLSDTQLSQNQEYGLSQRLTIASQNVSRSFEQLTTRKEDLKISHLDHLLLLKLIQQVQGYLRDGAQLKDVFADLETIANCLNDYLIDPNQYDAQPLEAQGIVQDIALLQPDALRLNLDANKDALVSGDKHNYFSSENVYIHPYSHEKRVASSAFQVGKLVAFPCGLREVIDITVDDTNSYITPCGILSSNCFIGFNELTKYPTPDLYDLMMSCNRSSFTPEKDGPGLKQIPLMIFSTTNPKGPGHNWVKKRFIDPAPYGKLIWKEKEVFNPKTKQIEIVRRSQVALFGSYKENIYLPAEYIAGMDSITDENTKKAWLEGSWDVVDGGAFDDVWDSKVHIAPRFPVPAGWRVDRSFDWGSSDPFSVQWWAEANGEEVEIQGRKWAPPAGTLFLIAEWYGAKEIGLNKGLGLSATEIAQGIIEREVALMEEGWIQRQPWPGPADNQIGNTINIEDDTLEKRMSKLGVRWTKSDKSPGSRKIGFALMRDRLHNSLVAEGPGFYVMRNCQAFLEIFPTLPRDPDNLDDVDTSAEEHIWDSARYRVLKGSDRYSSNLKLKGWT